MNKGVEILIERMRTNPEDFDHDGKFADTARRIREEISGSYGDKQPWFTRHLLTEAEWEKLKDAFIEMSRDKFTESVMKNLLKDKEEPRKIYPQSAAFGLSTGTVSIAPTKGGPAFDFNDKSIGALNEMVKKWVGEEDGFI